MAVPKQVNRSYVRRRAGAEWFFKDRPLSLKTLIDSIEEDFSVRISAEEGRALLLKYVGEMTSSNRNELEKEFVGAIREIAIENPEFLRRLKSLSIEELGSGTYHGSDDLWKP